MQKDSAQAKILLKVVGGLLFLTHPVCRVSGDINDHLRNFNTLETMPAFTCHHRLNGSSSPVLTATCPGVSVTFWVFFPNRSGGHTPRPILTQNGSNDVNSRKDVPFGVKLQLFKTPTLRPPKPPKLAQFWSVLSLDFAFNIGGITSKRPLFFI